jgi:ABC-type multidrug transport system fused ATPase/permease subunit
MPEVAQETSTAQKPVPKINRKHLRATIALFKRYLILFRRQMLIVSVFSAIAAVASGVVPYIMGKFFDQITKQNLFTLPFTPSIAIPLYAALLILWAALQLLSSFSNWRINNYSTELGYRARFEYSSDVYKHLIELPMSFHKTNKLGEVSSKINRASGSIETIFGTIIITLAPQFISILIAAIIILHINWPLGLFLLGGILFYVIIALHKVLGQENSRSQAYDTWNESYGYAEDVVQNVIAVKQATAEGYEQAAIEDRFKNKLFLAWMNLDSLWNTLFYYQSVIIIICQIVIFAVSIYLIHVGSITIGDLIAFNAYSAMMFGPFVTLMNNWQQIQNGILNIGKLDEILMLAPEIYEPMSQTLPKNTKDMPEATNITGDVEFDHVGFGYEAKRPILHDITFKVKHGEIVALVGESGVGKSTLVDLISAFHFPTSGRVLIDGLDVRTLSLSTLRSSIAVVPQEVVLFNDTIKTNIKYGNFDASDAQLEEATREAYAYDFIDKFPQRWDQLVGERGVKLSVGQKQRVSIARAILRNPKILILDEPTSALDAGSEHIITESLEKLMRGKTTFIIAHRLSTVRKAHKIIVLKNGRIVETGTHEELIKRTPHQKNLENTTGEGSGEYRRLYELQIGLRE